MESLCGRALGQVPGWQGRARRPSQPPLITAEAGRRHGLYEPQKSGCAPRLARPARLKSPPLSGCLFLSRYQHPSLPYHSALIARRLAPTCRHRGFSLSPSAPSGYARLGSALKAALAARPARRGTWEARDAQQRLASSVVPPCCLLWLILLLVSFSSPPTRRRRRRRRRRLPVPSPTLLARFAARPVYNRNTGPWRPRGFSCHPAFEASTPQARSLSRSVPQQVAHSNTKRSRWLFTCVPWINRKQ